jgi:hypothetical protein
MAIQYYMRGYDAILDTDVDWVVNDTPDTSGAYSGSSNPLTNIRVNRTVQSPVDSLIKPSIPSFVSNQIPGISQNFLYLNSYDWVYPGYPNIPPPVNSIPAPAANYGIAVMRGSVTLPTPNNYASLYWNDSNTQWTFNVLDSGTFNPSGSVSLAVGSPTPTTGVIRIPHNQFITGLDSTGLVDVPIIGVNNAVNNRVEIGNISYGAYVPGQLIADQYLALTNNTGGTAIVAASGLVRAPNNTVALAFANNAASAILDAISSTATDQIVIGESTNNQGVTYRVGNAASSHNFEINGSPILSISKDNINGDRINFDVSAYSPVITQDTQSVGNGKSFTIEAQSTSDVAGSGGDVILSSGSGAISSGYVDLRVAGIPKFRVNDTTNISYNGLFQFERNLASVEIEQEVIGNAFGLASNFTISAQDNNGIGGTAGDLILTSGSGLGVGTNGNLYLQNGGTNQLEVRIDAIRLFTNRLNFYEFITAPYDPIEIGQDSTNQIGSAATDLKIFAQSNNAVGSTGAGNLYLTSGISGSGNHGDVVLQVGGVDQLTLALNGCNFTVPVFCNFYANSQLTAQVVTDKFITNKGRRRAITPVDDTTFPLGYTIVAGDDVISVTSITAPFTVSLPVSPVTGDTYTIKDTNGNAALNNITINSGIINIDSAPNYTILVNYQSLDLIYTGSQWSII